MSRKDKKEWSLDTLLSVIGFIFELVRVVVDALRKRNGTVDDLRRLLKEPELVDQVFDLIVRPEKKDVPPSKSLWQNLLDACRQKQIYEDFTEAHYPLEPVAADESEWEVYEHHFEETVTGEEAFTRLEKLGYRHLNGTRRAMQFVAEHPNLQLDHPLVVTARWQFSVGRWCAPVFCRDGDWCELGLDWLDSSKFEPCFGWLVLRKRS